jgi:RNA polymerase sigma factor (sigma-70 family)
MSQQSREEQADLCVRARDGDVAARDLLIKKTMGLLHLRAHKWLRLARQLELNDLVSEGIFGLLKAIQKYDPVKGAFSTYAVLWIDQSMRIAVATAKELKQGDVRRPKFSRKVQELCAAGETRERAIDLTAKLYNVKVSTVQGLCDVLERRPSLSLNHPFESDGEQGYLELGDTVPINVEPVDEVLIKERATSAIRDVIARVGKTLSERDRLILDTRIFADDEDEATLADLGAKLKLSRERIRQLEVVIRSKLKFALAEHLAKQDSPSLRCGVCGLPVRRHNRHGICHAHGRSKTFDAYTGKCKICDEIVPAKQRGAHARLHTLGGLLSTEEILRRQRRRATLLRNARRNHGLCVGCGTRPPLLGRKECAECAFASKARGAWYRRRNGRKLRQPVMLTFAGETLTLADWSHRTGISLSTIWGRLNKGWSIERAFEQPKSAGKRASEKTLCVKGHARTPENLWTHKKTGKRHCRICARDSLRQRRALAA